jgi:hypothetical protein
MRERRKLGRWEDEKVWKKARLRDRETGEWSAEVMER